MGTQEAEDLVLPSGNSTLTGESLVEDSANNGSVIRLRRGWGPYGLEGWGAVALARGQCSGEVCGSTLGWTRFLKKLAVISLLAPLPWTAEPHSWQRTPSPTTNGKAE